MNIDGNPLGKPLMAIFCYNNGPTVRDTLSRIPEDRCFDVVVNDDGSSDDTPAYIAEFNFPVLRDEENGGTGYAVKKVVRYARENGYRVVVLVAGNGKDDPGQAERLLKPIYEEGYDYVQGSRRLTGGRAESLPLFRQFMVPVHAWLFRLLTGFPCTDALNGFRAYKVDIFFDD
ncbi:MAG: glycosyltransferase family 2 protein, partial [bacterium]|nr:glycosyltransferase family 2 protein [bacterium]